MLDYLGDVKVCGTRVVDAKGFVISEMGSCVIGSVAWLERQKRMEEAMLTMRLAQRRYRDGCNRERI